VQHDGPLSFEEILEAERAHVGSRSGEAGATGVRRALCISGGGIRSATFGLGAIQGLARAGLLNQFDYLSTVSGGGYIGSWLTAWKHRAGGLGDVAARLCSDAPRAHHRVGQPDPVQHLREYNSYLSPRVGALSSDLWTLVATILRNVLLNWLVLIPLLLFVLMVPRLFLTAMAFPGRFFSQAMFGGGQIPNYRADALDVISHSSWVWPGLPLLSAVLFGGALFFTLLYLPGVGNRQHSRFEYIRWILAPLVGSALVFMAFDSLFYLGTYYKRVSDLSQVLRWTLLASSAAWILALAWTRSLRRGLRVSTAVFALAAGTGLATWVSTNFVLFNPDPARDLSWAAYVTVGLPVILLGFCLGAVLFVGLSSTFLADEDREWMARSVAGVLLVALVWASFCAAVLMLPRWAREWHPWGHGFVLAFAALFAWLSSFDTAPGAEQESRATLGATVFRGIVRAAPAAFLIALAGILSVFTDLLLVEMHELTGTPFTHPGGGQVSWLDHYAVLDRAHPAHLVALTLAFLAFGWAIGRYININTFSLHAMYRDRLIRAYLGASNSDRQVSPFTGFAANDDLKMADLRGDGLPFHVINLTLDLVATSRLAWQERKAESFTMTGLYCGSRTLGYRTAESYAGGVTLGTAVALSGAAVSPNMGYHSSPVVGFIMMLFNARLGAWLGNPGRVGSTVWTSPSPRSTARLMAEEALGQTTDKTEFVYLSDGGHFENLGLYEMVWRRCELIVVLDAGCDPEFRLDDLGNALRKIRIDFGVSIDFDEGHIQAIRKRERRCALATIGYVAAGKGSRDGRLVYVKPVLLGNESPDVGSYAAAHPTFPHQSTTDQWFDESQTESYRQLGLWTIEQMCTGWGGGTLADFERHLDAHLGAPASNG